MMWIHGGWFVLLAALYLIMATLQSLPESLKNLSSLQKPSCHLISMVGQYAFPYCRMTFSSLVLEPHLIISQPGCWSVAVCHFPEIITSATSAVSENWDLPHGVVVRFNPG